MKKLLVMTAVAAVVALVTSGTAQARHGRGGSCCSMGCGYGGCGYGGCGYGGFGGCGYGGGFGGCGFGGCGYGGGMMMGGYGGGCGVGGCGYAGGFGGFGGIGSYAMAPASVSQEAVVVVALPEDAVLTVDGEATTSTSSERVFRTPDLEAGKDFHYTLKARYVQNGKEQQITRTITVRSGEVTRIDLSAPAAASTETAMAR